MKLQFDSSQPYQLAAVQAVVDLFEGQPLATTSLTPFETGNRLLLAPAQLLANVRAVQIRQGLAPSERLEPCVYRADTDRAPRGIPYNFTVEMETGTGKTYTYLRTIYELHNVYGFAKFVIVVPSVAIREGVVKNLQITHEHLQALYGHPPVNFMMYESGKLAALRNFATARAMQILVINIDSFTKDANVINQVRETGVRPLAYLQSASPLVILDEPQNMETDLRKAALHRLNPLCTLRYSATHRNFYNLVYRLNPVQAYDLGLVKQIEVDGISADRHAPAALIYVKRIQPGKQMLQAVLTIQVNAPTGGQTQDVRAAVGDDLFRLSDGYAAYRDGFVVNQINAATGELTFSNGLTLAVAQTHGGLTDEIMQFQIERTVQWHFAKARQLQPHGIKTLSLFFLDRVAHYREYAADGTPRPGKFAHWFEAAFTRCAQQAENRGLIPFPVAQVHNGYFSQDHGQLKDTKGATKADDATYALIMREKERLLSLSEPLQFIFSHTALREGWDNPNVFQICTLNESRSDLKKRQEIGRGLRLPVDQQGRRVQDARLNVLTVIANASYEKFSAQLQQEIQAETSVNFDGRIKNARAKVSVRLIHPLNAAHYPLFFAMWEKIKPRTRYRVEFQTDELIRQVVAEWQAAPPIERPVLSARTARLHYTARGLAGAVADVSVKAAAAPLPLPDVYAYLQCRVNLTRQTIFEILRQAGRCGEFAVNPQLFLDQAAHAMERTLQRLMVAGISYERLDGQVFLLDELAAQDRLEDVNDVIETRAPEKTLTNYIPVKNAAERDFIRACETDERIRFFGKLPRSFAVPTPVGPYAPTWAVVVNDNGADRYCVCDTRDQHVLRERERLQILCAARHFALFASTGVTFRVTLTPADV